MCVIFVSSVLEQEAEAVVVKQNLGYEYMPLLSKEHPITLSLLLYLLA